MKILKDIEKRFKGFEGSNRIMIPLSIEGHVHYLINVSFSFLFFIIIIIIITITIITINYHYQLLLLTITITWLLSYVQFTVSFIAFALESGSVLCRIPLWDCVVVSGMRDGGMEILTCLSAQPPQNSPAVQLDLKYFLLFFSTMTARDICVIDLFLLARLMSPYHVPFTCPCTFTQHSCWLHTRSEVNFM